MVNLIILIIVATGTLILPLSQLLKYRNISANGIETEAEIVGIENLAGLSYTQNKFPIVSFVTNKHETVTHKASVRTLFTLYQVGQKVTVVYLSADPTIFFIKSGVTKTLMQIIAVVGAGLILLAAYILAKKQF